MEQSPAPVTASQFHDTRDPTAYDRKTPTGMKQALPSRPRRLAAATSATYSEATNDTAPHPTPVSRLQQSTEHRRLRPRHPFHEELV